MNKAAHSKGGFNLLTTSKEFKGRGNAHLAPIKQQSLKKHKKERSNSIKSPRILKGITNTTQPGCTSNSDLR